MLVSDYTTGNGVYNGWHWRYIGIASIGVVLLQIISFYTIHWPILESTQIAMFIVLWFIISRVRERRFLNGLAGTIVVFIVGLVLQFTIDPVTKQMPTREFWQSNITIFAISILLAYLYTKMQAWSERKREQMEAKRRGKMAASKPDRPQVRVHRKNKKKR
jgi:membrane-bound ClpP family serine protease